MVPESAADRERRILAEIAREEDRVLKTERERGGRLVQIDDGKGVRVVRIPGDPIEALQGSGKGEKLLERLLQDRREDRERGS